MAAGGFEAAANDNIGSSRGNSYDMNEERESFESTRSCFDLPLRSHPSIHLTDSPTGGGGLIYNDVRGRRIVIRHKVHPKRRARFNCVLLDRIIEDPKSDLSASLEITDSVPSIGETLSTFSRSLPSSPFPPSLSIALSLPPLRSSAIP